MLTLIASGLSNTEMAERLFVSEGAVKSHINHLLAKRSTPASAPGKAPIQSSLCVKRFFGFS
jgi:predicted ArsR family transcriptional regulator